MHRRLQAKNNHNHDSSGNLVGELERTNVFFLSSSGSCFGVFDVYSYVFLSFFYTCTTMEVARHLMVNELIFGPITQLILLRVFVAEPF
jgi:hypothetical protein